MKIRATLAALALLAAVPSARAWDTQGKEADPAWFDIYVGGTTASNEHAAISDETLEALGLADLFGRNGTVDTEARSMVDLNSSFRNPPFHPEAAQAERHERVFPAEHGRMGDNPKTLIEERTMPAPSNFSGVPDFSYSMYDWINKNQYCPPLPDDALDKRPLGFDTNLKKCHKYSGGWLGYLNASHFGSLASRSYTRIHQLAIDRGKHAQRVRSMLDDDRSRRAYGEFAEEAELEALAIESYAQHFLQDRWSSGHPWERWNATEYEVLASTNLLRNGVIAAFSGLLHGSEAITGTKDPMCSPSDGKAVQNKDSKGALFGAIGDYRFGDMQQGEHDVAEQRERMRTCGVNGYAEVIREFGRTDSGAATYGAFEIPAGPIDAAPSFASADCLEHWATNEALDTGWFKPPTSRAGAAMKLARDGSGAVGGLRRELQQIDMTLWANTRTEADKKATNLARGGLGTLGGAEPGSAYELGGYVEPETLDGLPNYSSTYDGDDRAGRDRSSFYGLFNQSHADVWCEQMPTALERLRGSDERLDEEVCMVLADRVYAGIELGYDASDRFEERKFEGSFIEPVCHYMGMVSRSDPETIPYRIHPGYVADDIYDTLEDRPNPNIGDSEVLGYWCRQVPVVDRLRDDVQDIVGRVFIEQGGRVTLSGANFGSEGTVLLARSTEIDEYDEDLFEALEVVEWSDDRIVVDIPEAFRADPGRYRVRVFAEYPAGDTLPAIPEQDRSIASVGRFLLDFRPLDCREADFSQNVCPGPSMSIEIDSDDDPDWALLESTDCLAGALTIKGTTERTAGRTFPARIDGLVTIQQTRLTEIVLAGLESVDVLEITQNASATEVSLPDLVTAHDFVVGSNNAATVVQAPKLECVTSELDVSNNLQMERTDLSNLRHTNRINIAFNSSSKEVFLLDLETVGKPGTGFRDARIWNLGGAIDLPLLRSVYGKLTLLPGDSVLVLPELSEVEDLELGQSLTRLEVPNLSIVGLDGTGVMSVVNTDLQTSELENLYQRVCQATVAAGMSRPAAAISGNKGCPNRADQRCGQSVCDQDCFCTHSEF